MPSRPASAVDPGQDPVPRSRTGHPSPPRPGSRPWSPASRVWLWSTPAGAAALATRDLGTILRAYRSLTRVTQQQLADLLGYERTVITHTETGRRATRDVPMLRHIANVLGIPPHILGITDASDADFAAMLQFGESTVRLANLARQSGQATVAVNELWPLVARLQARAAEGHLERDLLRLFGQAQLALGVSLGTVLPEERLTTAARWTGRALQTAQRLGDNDLLSQALQMHGNELRKTGRLPAAIARLHQAANSADNPIAKGTALMLLARAAGEFGDRERFDRALSRAQHILDRHGPCNPLLHPFSWQEIQLRGLLGTGRAQQAAHICQTQQLSNPAAPQWHVIARVTIGQALLTAGDHDGAHHELITAIREAEHQCLPHQIQRVLRIAGTANLSSVVKQATVALHNVDSTTPVISSRCPPM